MPRSFALIAAAGNSARMQSERSKLLLDLCGKSVLERCLKPFVEASQIERIVVVVSPSERAEFERVLAALGLAKLSVVTGGATRHQSVRNGLVQIERLGAKTDDYVVIHDAARCLLTTDQLLQVIGAVHEFQAVSLAAPIVDTLKHVNADGIIDRSIERDGIWAMQTPQAFRFDLIKAAHARAAERDESSASDDTSLVQELCAVKVLPSTFRNLKITYPADLELARKLIASDE